MAESLDKDFGVCEHAPAIYGAFTGTCCRTLDALKPVFKTRWVSFKGCLDRFLTQWLVRHSWSGNIDLALCAGRGAMLDGVAYCLCEVKHGDRISLPFTTGDADVCSTNAAGANNKYMISTYSLLIRLFRRRVAARSTPARQAGLVPTLSATAVSAGEAARRRRFRASTSPCQRDKSFVPAPFCAAGAPWQAYQIIGLLPLRQVLLPVLQRRYGRQQRGLIYLSAHRLARFRVSRPSSTAMSRPSTSVGSSPTAFSKNPDLSLTPSCRLSPAPDIKVQSRRSAPSMALLPITFDMASLS